MGTEEEVLKGAGQAHVMAVWVSGLLPWSESYIQETRDLRVGEELCQGAGCRASEPGFPRAGSLRPATEPCCPLSSSLPRAASALEGQMQSLLVRAAEAHS